jgi:hypothetical protein
MNGSVFPVSANIPVCADAGDRDGHVVLVEFFDGTNSIGSKTNAFNVPLCIVWSNAPAGVHVLTAKATDNGGASAVSGPVTITVRPPPDLPTVSIRATDDHAAEGGTNTGTFTISRFGGTNVNQDVVVNYAIGGSASNGVDYVQIPASLTIPGGVASRTITITPIDDTLIEGTETVVLSLLTNAAYLLGDGRVATVFIEDNDRITNARPLVHITAPTNGSIFASPVNISITAEATDPDDAVARVDFFANDHLVGRDVGTNKPVYSVVWSNVQRGFYLLTAVATDTRGGVGVSAPVHITVTGTNPPPPTNPIVTIFASDPIASEGTNFWHWETNHNCTNCPARTNTATFIVKRSGPTNASLTVAYEIRGSASNGVDYVAIPDAVTIPAGERSARITITPIDDTLVEPTETVILRLVQPTNAPPAYLVGWPGKAEAIILDNDSVPPSTGSLKDGSFHVNIPAVDGFGYQLQCSEDLIHWLPVGDSSVLDGGVHFADPEAKDFPQRFYRVVPQSTQAVPLGLMQKGL